VEQRPVVAPAPAHAQPQVALRPEHVVDNRALKPHGKIKARLRALAVIRHVDEIVQNIDATDEGYLVIDKGYLAMQAPQTPKIETDSPQASRLWSIDPVLRAHVRQAPDNFTGM